MTPDKWNVNAADAALAIVSGATSVAHVLIADRELGGAIIPVCGTFTVLDVALWRPLEIVNDLGVVALCEACKDVIREAAAAVRDRQEQEQASVDAPSVPLRLVTNGRGT